MVILASAEAPSILPEVPPPSNRGVTVAWAGVHWFAGTTRRPHLEVLEAVSEVVAAPVVEHSRGAKGGYRCSASVGGVLVAWGPDRDDVLVTVPGSVCEVIGTLGLVALSAGLDLDPTSRLDLAWDAHGFSPADVRREWEAGQVVTRAHRDSWRWDENAEGSTFYMGSRTSERFVRVYDRRGPTRVELELKEQRAVLLWRQLLEAAEDDWSASAMAELRAFVDFRDRSTSDNPRDAELLDWWAEFTEGAQRRAVVIPREGVTLDKLDHWLRRTVAPTLALVVDAFGPDLIRDLLTTGRDKYSRRPDRLAMLDAHRMRLELNAAD